MGAIATLTGNLFLVVGTIVCATAAILGSWIPPHGNWVYLVARVWSRGLLAASGIRVAARFDVPLRGGGPYVFMSNHQSLFDIPALIATLPGQTRFLAKRSLFRIPLFGWAIKLGGFISIDRRDRSDAGQSFSSAVQRLRTGVSALVFPEGTRSLDGHLLPFQRGGMLLALKSGLPIVPVGVRGTLTIRGKESYRIRPGRVEVRYGRPIDVGQFGVREKDRLAAAVRERIAELAGVAAE